MGEKFTTKLLKGIEDHRKNSSRFRIDKARDFANKISSPHPGSFPGSRQVTPAGSLRRGRETVGRPRPPRHRPRLRAGTSSRPPSSTSRPCRSSTTSWLVEQNKVTFTLRNNLQVDVRLLPRKSYGAAHAILHRLQAPQRRSPPARHQARSDVVASTRSSAWKTTSIVASETEEAIYNALDLDYIPPELRENCGELEAAASHTLAPVSLSSGKTCTATFTCTPPRPTARAPSARWPRPRSWREV